MSSESENKIKINGINRYIEGDTLNVGGHQWILKSVNPMSVTKPLEACSVEEMDNKIDELSFTLFPVDNGLFIQTKDGKHKCKYHTVRCDNCEEKTYLPLEQLRQYHNARKFKICGDCNTTRKVVENGLVSMKVNRITITVVRVAIEEAVKTAGEDSNNWVMGKCLHLVNDNISGWVKSSHGSNHPRYPRILKKLIDIYNIQGVSPMGLFYGLVEHYIETGEDYLAGLKVDITAETYTRMNMQISDEWIS